MKSIDRKFFHWAPLIILLFISVSATAQTVYVTKTGKKYHADGCQYLRQSKIETSLTQAQADGYSACSVCKPGGSTRTSEPKSSVAVQCSGTTKAGNRCKRMTTNASGRCYQH